MKMLISAGIVLAVFANCATAAINVTIQESGTNLVIASSGTLNSGVCTSIATGFSSAFNGIDPSVSNLAFGAVNSVQDQCVGTTITPTTGFGSGGSLAATTNTGVSYYFLPGIGFWGPSGWNSGTAMTASMSFANASLAGEGIAPGTYVYTFTNGATTDTLTINAIAPAPPVPTPTLSEWGVIIMIALMALVSGRRYRRHRKA
ncbi:MAG: IPTL-CTERM sorting domain-containing protein [Proteobacteria bacterium]|nr:IPTL-CTERM sorting domain-containing protein [Pseudomonadota bacterium]